MRRRKIGIFRHYYIRFLVRYFESNLCAYCGVPYCAYICRDCHEWLCECEDLKCACERRKK